MTNIEVISEDVSKGRQDVVKTWVLAVGTQKIRIQIKSDSYDFQSHARAEIWDDQKKGWNFVHSIHFGNMATKDKLFYSPAWQSPANFKADYEELLRVTLKVIQ